MGAQGDGHRQYPPPVEPWLAAQRWEHLLFAHWPVPAPILTSRLPPGLLLDTYDGQAWLAIVPFQVSRARPRLLPPLPWVSFFPEVNVRTYVTRDRHAGVYFFSLDADRMLAVTLARRFFHLPYYHARMRCLASRDGVTYESERIQPHVREAALQLRYRPVGPEAEAEPGSLVDWLTARYCLYSADRRGQLYRAEIDHEPWPLQPAHAEFRHNRLASGDALPPLSGAPLLHYARRLDVHVWPARRLDV